VRRLNGTTVGLGATLLLAATAGSFTLMNWWGRPLWWVLAGITFFWLAFCLVFLGWILPGLLSRRATESPTEPVEIIVDRSLDADTPRNVFDEGRSVVEVPPGSTARVPPGTTVRATASEEDAADASKDEENGSGTK
jgi:hypothetical protein